MVPSPCQAVMRTCSRVHLWQQAADLFGAVVAETFTNCNWQDLDHGETLNLGDLFVQGIKVDTISGLASKTP